ncbi:MAG: biopolymer transporter ExbD [Phycisphaerales bacterium]|nr:biopolymer transporter ExbD [Phycisphaerales bacterium]
MMRPPKPTSMTLNLAPMVDVLMCLIVFFLLAAHIVAAEATVVDVRDLPRALAAQEVDSSDLGNRVTISVRRVADGDEVAEYVVADWDGERIVPRALRPADIEALLKLRATQAVARGATLRCVIRADRMVTYQHVEVVLRACGLAQVRDVVFAARMDGDGEGPP